MSTWEVRPEISMDHPGVFQVVLDAYGQSTEARIIDRLRTAPKPVVSLVALLDQEVVGHIIFSRAELVGDAPQPDNLIMVLGPLAVDPDHQGQGIGRDLVATGLSRCRKHQANGVVAKGQTGILQQLGFRAASELNLHSEQDPQSTDFMALEMDTGSLSEMAGTVRYHAAFSRT